MIVDITNNYTNHVTNRTNIMRSLSDEFQVLLDATPPDSGSQLAIQIGTILLAKAEGEDVDDIMWEMVLEWKWKDLVQNTPPVYGDPIAAKIARIIRAEMNGEFVDHLKWELVKERERRNEGE